MADVPVFPQSQSRVVAAVLIWLPYGLLATWLLAAGSLFYEQQGLVVALGWVLRLIYLAGGALAWAGRPHELVTWAWAGFAIYAVVGSLLALFLGEPGQVFGVLLVPLAFLPWLLVMPLLARRGWEWAGFAALPHATLAAPLFLAAIAQIADIPRLLSLTWVLASLVIGGLAALFVVLPLARWRWWLVAALVLGQLATLGSLSQVEGIGTVLNPLALMLLVLSTVILFAPILLLNMARLTRDLAVGRGWKLSGLPDPASLVQQLRPRPAHPPLFSQSQPVSAPVSTAPGGHAMTTAQPQPVPAPRPQPTGDSRMLDRLFKASVVILTILVLAAILFALLRSSIYKIRPYERGLHLRGGRFIAVDDPGWHAQVPFVDTVIIVKVNERLGYVERIPAMTADDVTMVVSLEYTYRVVNPERFALEVDDPERIVFEFVQGKLRDVINTKKMSDVMHSRAEMNQEVMMALQAKETQYGVQFVTVQMQNASPPDEVVNAIKDRMVAVERQSQAQAEAEQTKTLADADFYAAQKKADGEAYRLEQLAEAEAVQTLKQVEAQRSAIELILTELESHPEIAEQYLRLMTVEALSENSKWILGGSEGSVLDLGLGQP